MADEIKTNKTPQVMNLVLGEPSEINPFIKGTNNIKNAKIKEKKKPETVEDNLRNYTNKKRGTKTVQKTKNKTETVIKNPILKIPHNEYEKFSSYAIINDKMQTEKLSIDVNRVLISRIMPKILERFKCCYCDICREQLTLLALELLPVNFIHVYEDESEEALNSLQESLEKNIQKILVKVIIENKRKPFH